MLNHVIKDDNESFLNLNKSHENDVIFIFAVILTYYVFYLSSFFKESILLLIFSVEYVLRIWSCSANSSYTGFKGAVRFTIRPLMILGKSSYTGKN